MTELATKAILNIPISLKEGLIENKSGFCVKAPVFSFSKLKEVDITLGPEMKSTGEVMGKDITIEKAVYKALVASGIKIKDYGKVLFTIADKDKQEASELAKLFVDLGYEIVATENTAQYFKKQGIPTETVGKIGSEYSVLDIIHQKQVELVINTTTLGKEVSRDGFKIRREAVENAVACLTSLDTARFLLKTLESMIMNVREI